MPPPRTEQSSPPIRALPPRVYLDTQFVFAYLVLEDQDHHAAVSVAQLVQALADVGSVRAFISLVVLDELAWKLGGVLYNRDAGPQEWRKLNDRGKEHEYRQRRAEIAEWLRQLLGERWVSVLPADEEVCRALPAAIANHGLRPADACHLACAVRHGVRAILTNDPHFARLADPPVEALTYR